MVPISYIKQIKNRVPCVRSLLLLMAFVMSSSIANAASILSVAVPADGTYTSGDTLEFTVSFDENVTPIFPTDSHGVASFWLELTLESGSLAARYSSVSGADMVFTADVTSKDFDFDGISISHLELHNGDARIVNSSNQDADVTLNNVPDMSMVLIDHGNSVTIEAPSSLNQSFEEGDSFDIYFRWRRVDSLILQGSPDLQITVGSTPYLLTGIVEDDALKFTHTVQTDDLDTDGIALDSLSFNGGALSAGFQTEEDTVFSDHVLTVSDGSFVAYSNIKVGPIGAPVIESVTVPTNGTYSVGDLLDFSVVFNESVTVYNTATTKLLVDLSNEKQIEVPYLNGSSSDTLNFQYSVLQGDIANGITITELITTSLILDVSAKEADLTLGNLPDTSGIIIDGSVPEVTSVTVPTATTYITGDTLTFKVAFDEVVTVTGSPELLLTIGSETVVATYVSGSGTDTLLFTYQVVSGVEDADGISLDSLSLNDGSIVDSDGNAIDAELILIGDTSEILIDGGTSVVGVQTPSAGTYSYGEVLAFTVSFDEAVTVNGSPKLSIDIGGYSALASLTGGSGSTDLVFQYTIETSDVDLDGISVNRINDFDATIRNANGLDANLMLNNIADSSSVLVDGGAPSGYSISLDQTLIDASNEMATSFTFSGAEVGAAYDYSVTFAGGHSGEVTGTGSINTANQQITGIDVSSLGDGSLLYSVTLTDVNGNQGNAVTGSVSKSTISPAITSVDVPSAATYSASSILVFKVNTNTAVDVTGEPTLSIDIGGTSYDAAYDASSSSSNSLVFKYSIAGSESDNDGISVTSLNLNGGALVSAQGMDFDLTLIGVADTSAVLVTSTLQAYVSFTVNSSTGPLDIGDQLIVDLYITLFNLSVDTSGGTPSVNIALDSGTVTASYDSIYQNNYLRFIYTVQSGDSHSASNDLILSDFVSNGGIIKAFTSYDVVYSVDAVNTLTGTSIIAVDPEISSVSATSGNYSVGDVINVSALFNKDVSVTGSPELTLDVGGTNRTATYNAGSSTSDTLVFDYTVVSGDEDLDGIDVSSFDQNGSTIQDGNANNATLTLANVDTRGALIDATSPSGYGFSIDQAYINTDNELNARFSFSSAEIGATYTVNVSHNGGGAGTTSGTGTVTDTTQVVSGIDVSGIDDGELLFSVVLTDSGGNAGTTISDTVTKETVVPVVSSVTSTNGIYIIGNTLQAQVSFDDAVVVSGSPTLSMSVGSSTVTAVYVSGSNTNTLTFETIITEGQLDSDGISIDALSAEDNVIEDLSGNDAATTLNGVSDLSSVLVDAVKPSVSGVEAPVSGIYVQNSQVNFVVNFDEAVTVTGTPLLNLTVGSDAKTAEYLSGSDSSALTFQYVVASGEEDTDGLAVDSMSLNSGSILDLNGNDATVALNNVAAMTGVVIDGVSPTVTSVAVPAAGIYTPGDLLTFTVSYDETVVVSGLPTLAITIGNNARLASYVTGSQTSELEFSYTVVLNDLDSNGIAVNSLSENNGTLLDSNGNEADLTLTNVASTAGVLVDGVAPTGYNIAFGSEEYTKDNETSAQLSLSQLEIGASFSLSVSGSNGGEAIQLSGIFTDTALTLTGIDLSAITDGTLTAIVTISDSLGNQGASVRAVAEKINDAPEFTGSPSISGVAQFGSTLTLEGLTTSDHEGDQVLVTQQWLANGVAISGATEMAYALTAEEAMAEITAQITASDGKDSVTVLLSGLTVSSNPVFELPDDIEVNATGLLTLVDLVPASVVDQFGGALESVLTGADQFFEPGLHEITWQANDGEGNVSEQVQTVRVHPIVNFVRNKLAVEGNEAVCSVVLNGEAPDYPFTLEYLVSGTADTSDHDLVDGAVLFENGATEATIVFNVASDGLDEEDETLVIEFADPSVNTGVFDQQTVTIVNRNVAPVVDVSASQDGVTGLLISRSGGDVVITSAVSDGNSEDTHTYQWLNTFGIQDIDSNDSTFTFSPVDLGLGVYKVTLNVSDNGEPVETGSASILFKLVNNLPVLTDADTDGDGIADNLEGFGDAEQDGIPDYLDAINAINVIPSSFSNQTSFLAECEIGITCKLGLVSLGGSSGGVVLDLGTQNGLELDSEFESTGGVYDFEMSGFANGESVSVVLPLSVAIPENAVYRKLNDENEWETFIESANDSLSSALGNAGVCPPPNSDEWVSGLNVGDTCIQLTVQDGGPNDMDGEANGVIVDPGVLSTEKSVSDFETKGGGSLGIWSLVLGLIAAVATRAKARAASVAVVLFTAMSVLFAQQASAGSNQAPPLFNQEDIYLVGSFGWAWNEDGNKDDLNSVFEERGFNVEANDVENERGAFSLGLGVQLTPEVAVEAAYLDLGEVNVRFSGSADGQEQAFADSLKDVYPESGKGLATSMKYSWQFASRGFLYGRAGVFFWENDYELSHLNGAGLGSQSQSGTDLMLGVGIGHNFNKQWRGSAEVQRFEFDHDSTYHLSAQLNYFFGL